MNVASLELCRELYELSGWDGTGLNHYRGIVSWASAATLQKDAEMNGEAEPFPAYELGYLLRKLPKFYDGAEFWMNNDGLSWTAGYATDKYADGNFHFVIAEIADTPEDAAAKLAIELFKQKILVKGSRPLPQEGQEQ